MTALPDPVRSAVQVTGLVQGVGFRPHVHRLAHQFGLVGWVNNDTAGVNIEIEGAPEAVEKFVELLRSEPPPLARVHEVRTEPRPVQGEHDFCIRASLDGGAVETYVAPDSALCADCLHELFDPIDTRFRYPFITCTNCGPRFTITKSLPYDRPNTTMAHFPLCRRCAAEYHDPANRRFHAQPLACPDCGPQLWFEHDGRSHQGTDEVIAAAQRVLASGGVVAVKGVGGYHLACDARDEQAVATLRARKHRPDKPFAVMARDLTAARRFADISMVEADLLSSTAAPIVLLRRRHDVLAPGLAPGSPNIGVLLPYAPLHHLLFAAAPDLDPPLYDTLVMTSGNVSDEPICFDDDDARVRLASIADAWLGHDRPIHVPCDDSVVRVDDGTPLLLRRSRGYAPMPVPLPVDTTAILAVGGELKNTFCIARGRRAWLSQHIGDMGSLETLRAFDRSLEQFQSLYRVDPLTVVSDLHPAYHTTTWADSAAIDDRVRVQHHHAHLAALLAEHGRGIDSRVIGIVFDGTGFGLDESIWGGEVLVGGYLDTVRFAHLRSVPLPGGDAAVRKPYRSALAHLWSAGIEWGDDLPCVAIVPDPERRLLSQQFETGAMTVPTSSMGRLFDAVASILGIRHIVTYEAQAAMELEESARAGLTDDPPMYRFDVGVDEIDPRPVVRALVCDLRRGVSTAACAAGFHLAVANAVVSTALAARETSGLTEVGLTGGVFQNAVLTSLTRARLAADGFGVLTHRLVPPNDGGLALGQVAVAAARSMNPRS